MTSQMAALTAHNELSDFDELKGKVVLFVQPTSQIIVTDAASNAVASGVLKSIKDFKSQIESRRVASVKPLNDRVKATNEYAKEITKPLDEAEAAIKAKMLAFSTAERNRIEAEQRAAEQKRREEERLAAEKRAKEEAAARAKAEADARALREKQDAERKAVEEKMKAEADALKLFSADPEIEKQKQAEAARQLEQKQAQEKLDAERKAHEERISTQARLEREERERQKAAETQAASIAASRPKNTMKVRKYKITNPALVPDEFWAINEAMISSAVKAGAQEIAGVEIWIEEVIVTR